MERSLHVFENAIRYLNQTKRIVSTDQFIELVDVLSKNNKRIWTSGMGKAGLVAHKLAATLSSNSVPAAYMHAGEALHGDFGAIRTSDVLVAFSNSGKTNEVIQIVDKARKMNVYVALITGDNDSELADKADICLCYEKIPEACIIGLTPTTSITVMLVIADAVAMAVQEKVGISFNNYACNHHSGYLGYLAREQEDQNG